MRRASNWTEDECLRILAGHWDDATHILDIQGLTEEVGGEDAAADLFAATLTFGLRVWERYVADALRDIILGHLLPQKRWLKSLWDYSEATIDSDPDEFVRLYTLISAAKADFVRTWMAKPLLGLCQNESESRRMLGFQGLECLIKSGAAESVKRFESYLRQIAISAPDIRDKKAATELMTMLRPIPVNHIRVTPQESYALSQIAFLLPELNSILPSTRAITRADFQKGLQTVLEWILSRVGADDGPIDMMATELEFPSFPADWTNGSRPIRAVAGRLSPLFQEDLYPDNEVYPFVMDWRYDIPLLVQIFGSVTSDYVEENREPGAFTVTLEAIRKAKTKDSDLNGQANELLILCPSTSNFGNVESRQAAAKVAIQSTRYTQVLMEPEFARQHEGFQSEPKTDLLPHFDQRNLLFLTPWVANVCVGGTAIYSHYRLSQNIVTPLQVWNMYMLNQLGLLASATICNPG
ncbi:MAG: hypothetical protein A2Z25_02460 [Planctomycetes bacterium RBG_16_55_9]|nr:MAG: hypothetical protein A2Z25_02460 [Planctomycetes bacterium RBG_16_55_9]